MFRAKIQEYSLGANDVGVCNYPYGDGGGATQSSIEDKFRELQASGAGWHRTDFLWQNIETSKGTFNWTNYDTVVAAANATKMKLLPILCYSNPWANGGNGKNYPPTNNQDFADFCTAVVNRYYPQGLTYYEVWNEPNLSGFWTPVDSSAYAQLLKVAYIAIKAAQPNAKVITGGLAPVTVTTGDVYDYLNGIYNTIGNGYFDIFGFHPYGWFQSGDPVTAHQRIDGIIRQLRQIMVNNGDSNKKMWFTEIGRPTGGQTDFSTEYVQADMIQKSIRQMRNTPYIEKLFVYNYKDTAPVSDTTDRESHFGIKRQDGSSKPGNILTRETAMFG